LRVAPFCVEELADDLRRKPFEVRLLINALLREGAIVKLDSGREGGPFYEMPDYVEASRVHVSQCVLATLYRNGVHRFNN